MGGIFAEETDLFVLYAVYQSWQLDSFVFILAVYGELWPLLARLHMTPQQSTVNSLPNGMTCRAKVLDDVDTRNPLVAFEWV